MGWLFTIGFMIAGCVTGNTDAFTCAGLFAIAGAIAFNCSSKQKRLMGNKKGRPKKEDNKVFGYRLRLTKDEYERLDNLSKKTGETKINLFLEGFKMVENLKKIQFNDD